MSKDTQDDDHFMVGKTLLAMPGMGDNRFHKAVIYICAHDAKGAMGLVVNKPTLGIDIDDLISQLDLGDDETINVDDLGLPILSGGPVEQARGFLLHSNDFKQDETVIVDDHFSVTGTVSSLKKVMSGDGPENLLFILGYAGWSAGQLDDEIKANAWLSLDSDPDIIFNDAMDQKWNLAIKKLGINPMMLSAEGGRA